MNKTELKQLIKECLNEVEDKQQRMDDVRKGIDVAWGEFHLNHYLVMLGIKSDDKRSIDLIKEIFKDGFNAGSLFEFKQMIHKHPDITSYYTE